MVSKTAFLNLLLRHLVKQRLDAFVPAASQGRRSARDLPILQAPLQQQNIIFSNAGLFELLENLELQ